MSWIDQQAEAVEALAAAEAAAAAAVAADDSLARSVGLHIRGRNTFKEGVLDEEDPARFVYHRALKAAALTGNWAEAEAVVDDMSRAGNVPGPRAYHALVCAYVQASDAAGALGAIRRCWDASITPLPETYAAVVAAAVAAGDLGTAEAVVASCRRAGVDYTSGWQHLVIALFREGQAGKGMEVLAQGEAEGLHANAAVYEALIQHFCRQRELDKAGRVLELMKAVQSQSPELLRPGIEHYTLLINAHAEFGDPQAAFALLDELRLQGNFPQSMLGICHSVLEAQLRSAQSSSDVVNAVVRMKAVMMRHNLQPGAPFFTAQLQAALRLGDLQLAIQAFRALRHRSAWVLQGLDDDQVATLLVSLSRANLPAELHEVMAVMCREERQMPAAAMEPDEQGCTILGSWVRRRMDQAAGVQPAAPSALQREGGGAPAQRSLLYIDGVAIDPQALVCVDAIGAPVAVSRLNVRELRAELAARKAPLSGNKKELAKRVQKLRQIDDARLSLEKLKSDKKDDGRGKVAVVVTDSVWVDGRLVQETCYRDEQEVEAAQDEDGEDAPEWDVEEEEGAASRRTPADEELADDDVEVPVSEETVARYVLASHPMFTSPQATAHDAAALALAAVLDLAAAPSMQDLTVLAAWATAAGDPAAAVQLVAALDGLAAGPLAGTVPAQAAAEMREQLAEFCAERGVDVPAMVAALLRLEKEDDPLREELEQQMAAYEHRSG